MPGPRNCVQFRQANGFGSGSSPASQSGIRFGDTLAWVVMRKDTRRDLDGISRSWEGEASGASVLARRYPPRKSARREAVTRHNLGSEIRTRSLARPHHLVYCGQVDFLMDPGVYFNGTRDRTITSLGRRSHGAGWRFGVGHRPTSGLARKHGPAPGEALPGGGPRSKTRRTAAPLSCLWTAFSRAFTVVRVRSRIAPSASPLGSGPHPRRTEAKNHGQRTPLCADNPALAAQARSCPGPTGPTSDDVLEAGGTPA